MVHIRAIHAPSRQSYGRPRMTEELRAAGLSVGHRRVGRLMREYDIRVVRTRRFKVTTNSSHKHTIEPNLLGQDFSAPAGTILNFVRCDDKLLEEEPAHEH